MAVVTPPKKPAGPAPKKAGKGDVLIRRRSTVVLILLVAVGLLLWTEKTPWQVRRYDTVSRERLARFSDLVRQGRDLVAKSPKEYNYNDLRDIRSQVLVLQNSVRELPFLISGNKEIADLNKLFVQGIETMPVQFSTESIREPAPGQPPEYHTKYVQAMDALAKWKTGLDDLNKKTKARAPSWDLEPYNPY